VICFNPIRITKNLNRQLYPDGLEVPCGKCLGCRIAKRKEWALRMVHELSSWNHSIFVTLTYTDDKLPQNASLVKSDLQKFLKRLRKSLSYENRKIKYFACGEYGEKNVYKVFDQIRVGTQRPHYHIIIFGMSLDNEDKRKIMESWPFADWNNQTIRKNSFGLAETDSINYVAQYIDKKLSGEEEDKFLLTGRQPVFRLLSQGIGKEHCLKNSTQYKNNEQITFRGVNQSFPRYYLKLLDLENSDFRKDISKEKSIETVEFYTDIDGLTFDEAYRVLEPKKIKDIVIGLKKSRLQKEKNVRSKLKLKKDSKKSNLTL